MILSAKAPKSTPPLSPSSCPTPYNLNAFFRATKCPLKGTLFSPRNIFFSGVVRTHPSACSAGRRLPCSRRSRASSHRASSAATAAQRLKDSVHIRWIEWSFCVLAQFFSIVQLGLYNKFSSKSRTRGGISIARPSCSCLAKVAHRVIS